MSKVGDQYKICHLLLHPQIKWTQINSSSKIHLLSINLLTFCIYINTPTRLQARFQLWTTYEKNLSAYINSKEKMISPILFSFTCWVLPSFLNSTFSYKNSLHLPLRNQSLLESKLSCVDFSSLFWPYWCRVFQENIGIEQNFWDFTKRGSKWSPTSYTRNNT
mgnify:CR=1 FL=1